MGLDFGGILGAATHLTTAASKEKSLKAFLNNVNKFGIQTQDNFEVNFSGIPSSTFFIQNITIPALKQNIATGYYDAKVWNIPINFDFEREFSMKVLNDANGYIYSVLSNFIMENASHTFAKTGYTLTVRALTGDKKYKGTLFTLDGVMLTEVNGLTFDYATRELSTFNVNCKLTGLVATPGGLSKAANFFGAIASLIK